MAMGQMDLPAMQAVGCMHADLQPGLFCKVGVSWGEKYRGQLSLSHNVPSERGISSSPGVAGQPESWRASLVLRAVAAAYRGNEALLVLRAVGVTCRTPYTGRVYSVAGRDSSRSGRQQLPLHQEGQRTRQQVRLQLQCLLPEIRDSNDGLPLQRRTATCLGILSAYIRQYDLKVVRRVTISRNAVKACWLRDQ